MSSTGSLRESIFRDTKKWYAEVKASATSEELMNSCYLPISLLEMEARKRMP